MSVTRFVGVMKNTARRYGDWEGIIGNTLPRIEALELGSADEA